jgi:hypothetical protein
VISAHKIRGGGRRGRLGVDEGTTGRAKALRITRARAQGRTHAPRTSRAHVGAGGARPGPGRRDRGGAGRCGRGRGGRGRGGAAEPGRGGGTSKNVIISDDFLVTLVTSVTD